MNWLLDTNIVSETSKPRPDANCVTWLKARRGQCLLSAITVAELRYGIERMPEGKRKAADETEYQFLCEDYAGRFLDFDAPSAAEWGRYAAELEAAQGEDWWKYCDLRDTQIAAIAREHGFTIATRNVRHFPFCQTENPFDLRGPTIEPAAGD
jgi:predicted nucleic acid-binding protein